MEWIGIGICVAIGFYIAPFVIGAVLTVVGGIFLGIASLFSDKR